MNSILQRLCEMAVVPVIRVPEAGLALTAVEWLAESGIKTVEITLSTPDAFTLISRLRKETDLLIGAGTVLTPDDARHALDAGAEYLVSPATVQGLPEAAGDVPLLMGALTPSEVLAAHKAGAAGVKVFPASACGGASYIKALKSVFPDIPLVPTGGVTPDNVSDYLSAGAAFVGIGGNLVSVQALRNGDKQIIQEAARMAFAEIEKFRSTGDR
ncbi:MAG: bifunctional 4-hydroxy-2-oxoglutarate aldolase/2-dehydro-3-deoxy-phosphogluconate aldolase [Rhodospirillales bacterium]|nr:bifunctional 4-hydroxy-2-oxoglutarate aldolase/2-dehydro-3-deoxy-phosphogluconate aldolase [Rhodospirillales bacterium]